MNVVARESLRQRAEYTHKFNARSGRHGWLRLTPAYSVKIVDELIEQCDRPMRIFDPFSGTATTALSAAFHDHHAVTTDINPFLVWFGRAKTAQYKEREILSARQASEQATTLLRRQGSGPAAPPPIHKIERWWSPDALAFLCSLRPAIEAVAPSGSHERNLLLIAFCRTLIAISNASFSHQSMSFKKGRADPQLSLIPASDFSDVFIREVAFVLNGAAENPGGHVSVELGDAREPSVTGQFDRVITSPPYANRMSYIRELRPYMYWLGFLTNGRDAGELDWDAIGGTWGIATSRLAAWKPQRTRFTDETLLRIVNDIAHQDNKNGPLLANYVSKYFDDMWLHFRAMRKFLAPGAEVHYIVGNSTFYGVLLPTEQLYALMLERLGFVNVECRPIRKRNSKRELIEFDVTARWTDGGDRRLDTRNRPARRDQN